MNDPLKDKLLKHTDHLLKQAEELKVNRGSGSPVLNDATFWGWKSGVENLIVNVTGETSIFYEKFTKQVKTNNLNDLHIGVGILEAFKNALECGILMRIRESVFVEIAKDIFVAAQELWTKGNKSNAVFLVDMVLMNGLKRIAKKYGITVQVGDDINSLTMKLVDKEIFENSSLRQIQYWQGIQNSARHRKIEEYEKIKRNPSFEAIISSLQMCLIEHLG